MKSLRVLLLLLLACNAAWSAAPPSEGVDAAPAKATPQRFPAPPLFTAEYTVHADGFKVGEMHRAVKALGNETYLVETRVKTTGIVSVFKPDEYVERSVLRVTSEGYKPLEFSSHYTGRSKDVVESMQFDWDRRIINSLRDHKEKQVPLEPGILDKLMYQIAMQYDLSQGVTEFRYRVADRGKIEKYNMDVVGEEVLDTAVGKQRTVKVKKGTTMIWCAVELDYLPVKLAQKDDGHTLTSHMVSLKRGEPALPESP